jgi:plasmid stability protein
MPMPTIHVRNVPEPVYEALRTRAKRNGRSLNAEVVAALARDVGRDSSHLTVTERMEALARRIELPPDAPRPEDLIRELRDS